MTFHPGPEFVFFKITGIHLGDPQRLVVAEVIESGEVAAQYFPAGIELRVEHDQGGLPDITKPLERVAHYTEIPGFMVP